MGTATTEAPTTTEELTTTTKEPATTTVETTDTALRAGFSRIDRDDYKLSMTLWETTKYDTYYANSTHPVMNQDGSSRCSYCMVDDTMAPTTHVRARYGFGF